MKQANMTLKSKYRYTDPDRPVVTALQAIWDYFLSKEKRVWSILLLESTEQLLGEL